MRDFATLAKRAGKDLAFHFAVSAAMSILHKGVLVPLLEKLTPRLKRVSPAAADLLRKAVGMAIGSPYERVKTLLQNAPAGTSAIEVATRAVAADGAGRFNLASRRRFISTGRVEARDGAVVAALRAAQALPRHDQW